MRNNHVPPDIWREVAEFLGDAADVASLAELDRFAPARLLRLFSADLVAWERFNRKLEHLAFQVVPEPARPQGVLHEAFEHYFPEHPGFGHFTEGFARGMVFIMSDFRSTRSFVQTGLWCEVYIHLRARHQLGIGGPLDRETMQSVGVNRLTREFGAREREVAQFLRPRLHAVTRRVARREAADRVADALGAFFQGEVPYALIRYDGLIVEASAAARPLLQSEGRAMTSPQHLPAHYHALQAALAQSRREPAAGRRVFSTVALPGGITALVLWLGQGAEENAALAIFQLSTARARSVRLTARESEVLSQIGEGKNNIAIAAALGISRRTVEKHCTTLFAKIGVETRFAAALTARENFTG